MKDQLKPHAPSGTHPLLKVVIDGAPPVDEVPGNALAVNTARGVELSKTVTDDPYQVTIGGVRADPYRIARAYGLDATLGAALKKLCRRGRKHKTLREDVREAITTLQRWEEMEEEDGEP
jgi:hypothetical protein